jgi:hypothetical protein
MDGSGPITTRGADGRFLPGSSGNPAGKKPGTRNRATLLREALTDGEDAKLARIVIDKALAGDVVTARFLLDRLEPKPRGRPIHLDLPEGESAAGDVVASFNAALHAMAAGQITPDEAVLVSRFLEGRFRVLRAWQLEEKLTRWSGRLPVPGDAFVPEGVPARERSPLDAAPRTPSPVGVAATGTLSPTASTPRHVASPPTKSPHVASPPAARGERVAQGWRADGEPYPELGEAGVSASEVPDSPGAVSSAGATTPHPARARLDDVEQSLRNPLPAPRGEGKSSNPDGKPDIDDDLVIAVRDRLLTIPGVREVAEELGLLCRDDLHSACNSEET